MVIHVVQPGETTASIAGMYGVSEDRLVYDNQLLGQEKLAEGQALLVLFPRTVHMVNPGETLTEIAYQYGITSRELARNNPYLIQQSTLQTAQPIVVAYDEEEQGKLRVSGYAYPFIEQDILRESLLYLDELLVFSYGFTFEGELVPPRTDETWMLQVARKFQVKPILVLTPFAEPDVFNNQLVKTVIENKQVQLTLIRNLLDKVRQKRYAGVNVDFEYILPENREGYAQFVGNLHQVMEENGYQVSVALAPKTSAGKKGLLYEGMNYRLLGESADSVFLMTYEWGYTYGPPMAIAPLNKVNEVLSYALAEIPREKIVMGMPNYAYDWALPFVRGYTEAANISNVEATRIAAQTGAVIQFDRTSKSPHFDYWRESVRHKVWFGDVRSVEAKVQLALKQRILGIGYWSLMKPFRANWLLLNALLDLH